MKKHLILVLAIVTVLVVALAAVAQQRQGAERFRQRREAQMKALDTIQQNAAKLKTAMEESGRAMQNRPNYQDLSEDERAKLREEFMKRREEQQKLVAEMDQELMRLKGRSQLWREYDESMEPLKEILSSAQDEKAPKTAAKIEQRMAQCQKQFEDSLTSLGYDPTQRPRSRRQQ